MTRRSRLAAPCLRPGQWLLGVGLGLLFPGACAGLPDGNCPGGKFALEGAMRSSNSSTINSICSFIVFTSFPFKRFKARKLNGQITDGRHDEQRPFPKNIRFL